METRFATLADMPLIKKLLHEQPYDLGKEKVKVFNSIEEKINFFEKTLKDPEDDLRIFNLTLNIDEGEIKAMSNCIIRKWELQWLSQGMKLKPGASYFNCKTNGMSDVMTFNIEHAESLGVYSYNYIMMAGKNFGNRFQRMRDQIEIMKRYDYYDTAYLPAGEKPTLHRLWQQMGEVTRDSDIIFKVGMLRNEFRKPVYINENLFSNP